MANAGFQVFNDDYITIIDATFANLALKAMGTIATDTTLVDCSKKTITIAGVVGFPIVAVSATGGAVAQVSSLSGGTATITIYAIGSIGTTVNWWLFCDPTATPQYLAVWDATGKLVFNAAEKYMRYAGSLAVAGGTSTGTSITLPAGKTYATYLATPAGRGVEHTDTGGGTGELRHYLETVMSMCKIVANVISALQAQTYSEGPFTGASYPTGYVVDGTAFVVDVTDY